MTNAIPLRWQVLAISTLAIGGGAFLAMRQIYRGECIFVGWDPWDTTADTNQVIVLVTFATLFLVCSLLFGAAISRIFVALIAPPVPHWLSIVAGFALACSVYAALAALTWSSPPARIDRTASVERLYVSVFWPVGALQGTGNFEYACGV